MKFEDMLEELKQEYVQSLPERILHIEQKYERDQHEALSDDFHKLKGTGKTYGIPEISELSEVVETICIQRPEQIQAAIPDAVSLLKLIHAERKNQRSYNISQDMRFSKLKSLLNN